MAPETNQNDSPPWLKKLEYSSVGIEMGLSVAVGALIGYGLDKWLGTEPLPVSGPALVLCTAPCKN